MATSRQEALADELLDIVVAQLEQISAQSVGALREDLQRVVADHVPAGPPPARHILRWERARRAGDAVHMPRNHPWVPYVTAVMRRGFVAPLADEPSAHVAHVLEQLGHADPADRAALTHAELEAELERAQADRARALQLLGDALEHMQMRTARNAELELRVRVALGDLIELDAHDTELLGPRTDLDRAVEVVGVAVERLMQETFTPWPEDPDGFWHSASRHHAERALRAALPHLREHLRRELAEGRP